MRLILIHLLFCSCVSWAQESTGTLNSEFSVSGGSLLPYGIFGVRSTYPGFLMTYARDFSDFRPSISFASFNAHGVTFYQAGISFGGIAEAHDFQIEWYAGASGNYYKPKHTNRRTFGFTFINGVHLGLAPRLPITDSLFVRSDFHMSFNPGQSLYVGLGLAYLF